MDKQTDESERLRRALPTRAECGWGCFCDACWAGVHAASSSIDEAPESEPVEVALATYDALWRLAFGDDAGAVPAVQEARSLLERSVRSDDL